MAENENGNSGASNGSEGGSEGGKNVGRVEQVTGVVVDAVFPNELPEIYSAIEIEIEGQEANGDGDGGGTATLVCEVQQHLGDDRVRAVAMDATDGLQRDRKSTRLNSSHANISYAVFCL